MAACQSCNTIWVHTALKFVHASRYLLASLRRRRASPARSWSLSRRCYKSEEARPGSLNKSNKLSVKRYLHLTLSTCPISYSNL